MSTIEEDLVRYMEKAGEDAEKIAALKEALRSLDDLARKHILTVDKADREAPPYAHTVLADHVKRLLEAE